MKHSNHFLLITLVAASLLGCNNFVQDYVAEKKPENIDGQTNASVSSPMSLKVTPGRMNAAGGGMVVQGTITTTDQSFSLGSDRALSLTINRSRVQPK